MKKVIILVAILFLCFGAIVIVLWATSTAKARISLDQGKLVIEAELADSTAEISRGLSGREEIGEGEGMLFIFKNGSTLPFWMKGMKFDIDIIWIAGGEIIGIEHNVSHLDETALYYPPQPVDYVLEIRGGLAGEEGVKRGGKFEVLTKKID
ncbi:MAG: DUF192 domain-containing protein [Patescibacteria group bacterium]|nr:DUF192 domain-containing protein [Patescibacteria group bacterium]MDD5490543.1 DUF192 domain-containing protein [Patescibacteria group bacterium]